MYRLGEIASLIGAELKGDADCLISAIKPIQVAQSGDLSFISNPKYQKYLPATKASAVIVTPDLADSCPQYALIAVDPYLTYAKAATLFMPKIAMPTGVHPTAVIGEDCDIDPTAAIGPYVVLGNKTRIGPNTCIYPNTVIGQCCQIGSNVILFANVTLYDNVLIGDAVIIHSGAVLGSDGFGLAKSQGEWLKIPQLGRVIIHDKVEIGANTTIDRGALGDTILGEGVKLDNQIQVGHNVIIGDHTAIAACTGISGSVEIGQHCLISGMVGFTGHFKVTDHVTITGQSMVSKGIDTPGVYSSGTVIESHDTWKKNAVRFKQLDQMARRIKELEKQLVTLSDSINACIE